MKSLSKVTIRLMFNRDLSAVLEIERKGAGEPWSRKDFLPVFRDPDTDGWVAEADGQVVGFAVFRRETVDGRRRIVLLNLGVAPYWRRSGVGKTILKKLDERRRSGVDHIQATVPETNLPFQLFLRAAGFKAVRVLRGHFGDVDGYLMERAVRPLRGKKSG